MSIVTSVVDEILKLHGTPAYALVGGLAFAEAALFVGFVLPGETAVLLGGVLANQHRVSLAGIAAVAVLAAIIGDSIGYEVGRHFGTRLLDSRVFERRQKGIERGKEALRANGGRAVFLARFTAFLRAVMPGLAGTVRMPYRRFLAFNAAGGLIWAVGFTMLGYLAGASYHTIETIAGRASEIILAVIVVAVLTLVIIRRRRERDPAPHPAADPAASPADGRPDGPSPSPQPAPPSPSPHPDGAAPPPAAARAAYRAVPAPSPSPHPAGAAPPPPAARAARAPSAPPASRTEPAPADSAPSERPAAEPPREPPAQH